MSVLPTFVAHATLEPTADSASVFADTLRVGAEQGVAHPGTDTFGELLHHVQDAHELETPFGILELPHFAPIRLAGLTLDMSVTKHVVFVWLAAVILCLVAAIVARRNARTLVPKGFGNLFELFVVFMRDDVVLPNMGPAGLRYFPYILTTFFFILVMNLLGILPWGASATGNVSVTAGLAIIAFVMIQTSAIRAQGLGHYLAHLTGGAPVWLWPIMVPIEILGLFTKPFALCMRLFANMLGGHIVLVSLIGLIFLFKSYIIAIAPALMVIGINFLELFVAFLQAYIFVVLTSLFMGIGIQAGDSSHGHAQTNGETNHA